MVANSKRDELHPATERLLSIDALRGFDMFWIIGGEELFRALATAGKGSLPEKIEQPLQHFAEQLEHVEWAGFHFYDLIFPLFLFLVGAVIPFSLGKLGDRGAKVYWRVLGRAALLLFLGLV